MLFSHISIWCSHIMTYMKHLPFSGYIYLQLYKVLWIRQKIHMEKTKKIFLRHKLHMKCEILAIFWDILAIFFKLAKWMILGLTFSESWKSPVSKMYLIFFGTFCSTYIQAQALCDLDFNYTVRTTRILLFYIPFFTIMELTLSGPFYNVINRNLLEIFVR